MNITDKISKHYQSSIGGELKKIHVEEWDTDIYYRTTYPFKTEAKVIELQSQGKTVEALVESLIAKGLDRDGKRLFQDADRIKLMHEADPNVIVKVCTEINNAKLTDTQANIAKE
jgi:hypothetical protein